MIHGVNVRCTVLPGVLHDLFIRVGGTQGLPRSANEPLPGPSGNKPLSKFDGGDYRLDVEVSGEGTVIDDGRIKRIRAPEFDFSTCSKTGEGRPVR